MADELIGMGTAIYMAETPEAAALTKLGRVKSVDFPDETTAELETTNYDSDGAREFIPGLTDGGSVPIVINWRPGDETDEMLIAAKADRKRRLWRIVTPEDEGRQQATFMGYISARGRTLPVDNVMESEITVRVSGKITIEPAVTDPTVIGA
jgi:hypothetical protein